MHHVAPTITPAYVKATRVTPLQVPAHYLDSDAHYKDFLRIIRLEPFFRSLPNKQEKNPALYVQVRSLFKKMLDDGALNIFPDGYSLHQQKPGQMQFILSGVAQMKHNRYSRELPHLSKVGFDGPTFTEGQAIGSWSMAGMTGSHFGDIHAVGPVMTLSISPLYYGELIRLTLDKGTPTTKVSELKDDEVTRLNQLGALRAYSEKDSELFSIERQRDFDKRKLPKDSIESSLWERANLRDADFVIKKDDIWYAIRHPIQTAIKDATVTQHVLQKNFMPDTTTDGRHTEANTAPLFQKPLENEEFIALSRSCSPIKTAKGLLPHDTIILCTNPFDDVERPPKPMKLQSPQPLGTIEFSILDTTGEQSIIMVTIPSHGVIDIEVIQRQLRESAKLSTTQHLSAFSIESTSPLQLYQIDLEHYRDQLLRNSSLNLKTFFAAVENLGYSLSDNTRRNLTELISQLLPPPTTEESLNSRLSYKERRLALSVLQHWGARESKERMVAADIDLPPQKIEEIRQALSAVLNHERKQEDLRATYEQYPDKIRAIASRTLGISLPLSAKANYRDVKFLQEQPADPSYEKRPFNQMSMQPFNPNANLPWARHLRTPVAIIPDRHENLCGLQHELKGLGLCDEEGTFILDTRPPLHTLFLGDLINRRVSMTGLATLLCATDLQNNAEGSNHQVSILCGNHELDLMKMSPAALEASFRGFSSFVVAQETQKKLRTLGQQGRILAAISLGDDPISQESCIATHAGLDPRLKALLIAELERTSKPNPSDQAVTLLINNIFARACTTDDWSHPIFAKSVQRGGNAPYSGIFELDMQAHDKSDLAGIIAAGFHTFSPQIHGHSFSSSPEATLPRLDVRPDGSPITNSINVDGGDHQVFEGDPGLRQHALIITPAEDKEMPIAYISSVSLGDAPKVPSGEQEVYDLYKAHKAKKELTLPVVPT